MKQGLVRFRNIKADIVTESEDGYRFEYLPDYLSMADDEPISLTLPLTAKPYKSNVLFSFLDGLIPGGWLLDIAQNNWKINERDRMSLLLACCRDCIGTVSVTPLEED